MTLQNYLLITELIKQKHYINDFFFCICKPENIFLAEQYMKILNNFIYIKIIN